MGFEKRRYISYVYLGGNRGIQGIVKADGEKSAFEPINPNIYEGFINGLVLYDVCAIFEDIQNELDEIWRTKRLWELSDSPWVMREHYLQLLVKHRISHMSICIHGSLYMNTPYMDVFISRLDCLDEEQFRHITQVFKSHLANTEYAICKLYELPRFKWEGV